ncbi:MAG: enoyl-CoA hydratase/isomerase family protein [Rhodobacteraceae bacterium]|nr:enoyl-CoA hydratase/isomerase family protein [Paracoccaceae bacterium]
MNYETLITSLDDGIGIVTLNRPGKMNALTTQMRAEIPHAIKALQVQARVIVLTGVGRAFCTGQDLGDAAGGGAIDLERVLRDEYEPILRMIFDCPVPTIAAVNGPADAGGTYLMPRMMGGAKAMGAALFADKISAKQADDWGLIWESVADDDFDAHWRGRAEHLANGPTLAYRAVKEAIRGSWHNTVSDQLETEARLQGECGASRDFREGVVAFTEKRPASFEGR